MCGFWLKPGEAGTDTLLGLNASQKCVRTGFPASHKVYSFAIYLYKVFSNGIAELTIAGHEPLDCEIVIPTNMYMNMSAEQAIADAVQRFREENK
ncbi:MAG: hypothetical protein AB7F59_13970 [Bdellovibrionales bacterium]